jgi:hypothetical protein
MPEWFLDYSISAEMKEVDMADSVQSTAVGPVAA